MDAQPLGAALPTAATTSPPLGATRKGSDASAPPAIPGEEFRGVMAAWQQRTRASSIKGAPPPGEGKKGQAAAGAPS